MNRKKIMTLLLTLGIVMTTGLTATQTKVYADGVDNTSSTKIQSQDYIVTSTGFVGKFQSAMNFPYGKELNAILAMPNVVTLTPEKNYGLLSYLRYGTGNCRYDPYWDFNYSNMNLSNKIYHRVCEKGTPVQIDYFVALKEMHMSNGKLIKVFNTMEYQFNARTEKDKVYAFDDTYGYEKYLGGSSLYDTPEIQTKSNITSSRLAGSDRLATSLAIAKKYVGDKTLDNAVIAYGYNFVDALAGATLAKKMNSPIFLVGDLDSSQDTLNYISSKLSKNGHVYILGGQSVIPDTFKDWLIGKGYSEDNITRLGGINREGTAEQIANAENAPEGTPVVIASEENFPDALAISPVAAQNGYPILIVPQNSLPEYASNYLSSHKPTKVYCVGGTGSISNNVLQNVASASGLSSSNIIRIGGASRFDTALKVAETFYKGRTSSMLANGYNYPDAISGSVLAASENSPILLVDQEEYYIFAPAYAYITSMDARNATITALGGESAIDSWALDRLTHIMTPYSNAETAKINAYIDKMPVNHSHD